jgi:hypothetical protein
MYTLEIREHLDRTFRKLAKKDSEQMEVIAKKTKEIAEDPTHTNRSISPLRERGGCTLVALF